MLGKFLAATTVLAATLLPLAANAANPAIAVTNVNLRAGPSTAYPAVDVVGAGDRVRVFGCLSNRSWCDVAYRGIRGWMSSNYIAYAEGGRRYTGPDVVVVRQAPTVTFSIGGYWDDHYRARSWYRDRARYERIDGPRDRDWDRPPPRRDWDRDRDRDRWERDRRDRDWDRERQSERRERWDNDRFDPRSRADWEERRDWRERDRDRDRDRDFYRVEAPRPLYQID